MSVSLIGQHCFYIYFEASFFRANRAISSLRSHSQGSYSTDEMNTTSLILNGRTAATIFLFPERQKATITTLCRRQPLNPSSSGRSTPRRSLRDSPGWYNTQDNPSLEEIARKLETRLSRFEQWRSRCAQNIVMALMRPTPVVLFLFNPVAIMIWVAILSWWVAAALVGRE